MQPSLQVSSESVHVSVLFKKNFFEVPKNQRDYRWKELHREKLWEDILLAIENDYFSDRAKPLGHFMGSVVVVGKAESIDTNRWQVVDGQQRLTTLTILADCLRPFIDSVGDKTKKRRLSHILLDCILSPDSDDAPRVKLNSEGEFYHNSLILHETIEEKKVYWKNEFNERSEVQNNIRDAFLYFNEKIEEYIGLKKGEERDDSIIALVETVVTGLYFLLVRVDSLWMAYRIFETLNERGLDLTQAELIKNVLIENARETGAISVDDVDMKWGDFVSNYENQSAKKLDMPHLIQFSYTYRQSLVKKEDIFDEVSKGLRSGHLDSMSFVEQLELDSRNWSTFSLGDLVDWSEQQQNSQFAIVDPLWKKHCAPFILAVMDKFFDNQPQLQRGLLICEHYLFRQGLVCKDSVSTLQSIFSNAAALVRGGVELDEIALYFRKNSSDKVFVEKFKQFSAANMKQGFYCLWKIEKEISDKEDSGRELGFKPSSQGAAQHLEHIMPKKPGVEWDGIEREDAFNSMLNRIGNFLVLDSGVNQHIKNKSVDYKIKNDRDEDYSSSHLILPIEFVKNYSSWAVNEKWNFEAINLRQAFLADKYALNTWSLNI